MRKIIAMVVLLSGCAGNFEYRQEEPLPKGRSALMEYIASCESRIGSLEEEMVVAKENRDAMLEAAKSAEGWFATDSAGTKVSRANSSIKFVAFQLRCTKDDLAKARSRLDAIQECSAEDAQ